MTTSAIETALERILPRVTRRGRCTDGRLNQGKGRNDIGYEVTVAFPDIFDTGMSNPGPMIYYYIVNKHRNLLAERVYFPCW